MNQSCSLGVQRRLNVLLLLLSVAMSYGCSHGRAVIINHEYIEKGVQFQDYYLKKPDVKGWIYLNVDQPSQSVVVGLPDFNHVAVKMVLKDGREIGYILEKRGSIFHPPGGEFYNALIEVFCNLFPENYETMTDSELIDLFINDHERYNLEKGIIKNDATYEIFNAKVSDSQNYKIIKLNTTTPFKTLYVASSIYKLKKGRLMVSGKLWTKTDLNTEKTYFIDLLSSIKTNE